jgi:hypothetical protein
MNTSFLYPIFLILHLTALTIMAGSTIISYLGYRTFWKLLPGEVLKAEGVLGFLAKFARVIGIGAGLLIITGAGMMILTGGVYGQQVWFRIKFVIVILLIANSLIFRKRTGLKLEQLVQHNPSILTGDLSLFEGRINTFHVIQFILFFTIIFLSVFKFN